MESRNDLSTLIAAGIPAVSERFECDCWGKHQPPYLRDGSIIIETGQGYRSSKHLHGQNLYVIEAGERIALIEMRKYGDLYGAGLWHYLVGLDGAPFIAQVSARIETLAKALDSLVPAEVRRAQSAGADVYRQGDWYFIRSDRKPAGEITENRALDGDHIAEMAIIKSTVVYVRGTIRHSEHDALCLPDWHKALRNKAIRTGRLHGAGNRD